MYPQYYFFNHFALYGGGQGVDIEIDESKWGGEEKRVHYHLRLMVTGVFGGGRRERIVCVCWIYLLIRK